MIRQGKRFISIELMNNINLTPIKQEMKGSNAPNSLEKK